jgi:hypothetical protein
VSYEVAEVLAATPHRAWQSDNGTIHYFKVKLTSGVTAEAGKKKADTPPKVGDRYKTLRPLPDNAPQDALPTLQGPITDFQGGGQGDRGRNASMAVSYAKDLANSVRSASTPRSSSSSSTASRGEGPSACPLPLVPVPQANAPTKWA